MRLLFKLIGAQNWGTSLITLGVLGFIYLIARDMNYYLLAASAATFILGLSIKIVCHSISRMMQNYDNELRAQIMGMLENYDVDLCNQLFPEKETKYESSARAKKPKRGARK